MNGTRNVFCEMKSDEGSHLEFVLQYKWVSHSTLLMLTAAETDFNGSLNRLDFESANSCSNLNNLFFGNLHATHFSFGKKF